MYSERQRSILQLTAFNTYRECKDLCLIPLLLLRDSENETTLDHFNYEYNKLAKLLQLYYGNILYALHNNESRGAMTNEEIKILRDNAEAIVGTDAIVEAPLGYVESL